MCGVPIFILTSIPVQNRKLLPRAAPRSLGFLLPLTYHVSGWQRRWMAASGLGINVINGVLSLCQGSGWHTHLSPAEVAEGAGGPAERKQGKNLCRIAARLQQDWRVGVINVVVFHFCDPLESNHDFFFPRLFHFWLFLREFLTHCGQVAAQQKGKSPCSLLPTTCTFCFLPVPHLGSPPPSAKKKHG